MKIRSEFTCPLELVHEMCIRDRLDILLSGYNDGRKKTLFCVAVNLLELQELQEVLREIDNRPDIKMLTLKEKSAFVAGLLQDTASNRGIDLKLHKKKR